MRGGEAAAMRRGIKEGRRDGCMRTRNRKKKRSGLWLLREVSAIKMEMGGTVCATGSGTHVELLVYRRVFVVDIQQRVARQPRLARELHHLDSR